MQVHTCVINTNQPSWQLQLESLDCHIIKLMLVSAAAVLLYRTLCIGTPVKTAHVYTCSYKGHVFIHACMQLQMWHAYFQFIQLAF